MLHQPEIHRTQAIPRNRRVDVYLVIVAFILVSCQGPAPRQGAVELPGLLVETEWLARHASSGEVLLIDARPRADYDQGHLPGAVSVPTQSTLDPGHNNQLPPVPVVEAMLGQAGVTHDRVVIVYDEGNMRWAARLFWMLEVHGHARAGVLEGGLSQWIHDGRPVSVQAVVPEPTVFIANVLPEHLATRLDTFQAIDRPGMVIIDTRSQPEYYGAEEQWPRNGHIPGAINVEWSRNLETGPDSVRMKPIEELRQIYPYDPDTKFITYCTKGRRAAVTYLALRRLGFDSAVYDGSWSEWTLADDLPVEAP